MTRTALCLAFILCAAPVYAQNADAPPQLSLFFTPEEARQAEMLAAKTAPDAEIHLGAIMYYGPKDWTLWLQNTRWTPETVRDNLQVLEVAPNRVRLSWKRDEDSDAQEIVLAPNQSFQIATGRITGNP